MTDATESTDKSAEWDLIEKIDKAAVHLLTLIEEKGTSDAQKGRLFAQCVEWSKVRKTLIPPPDPGGNLKAMGEKLEQRKGAGRTAGSGRGAGGGGQSAESDGAAIKRIIGSLPKYGDRSGGNQKNTERPHGGDAGDGGSVLPDGGRNADRNLDGAGYDA